MLFYIGRAELESYDAETLRELRKREAEEKRAHAKLTRARQQALVTLREQQV